MSSVSKIILAIFIILFLAQQSCADNGSRDHWFGKDKFEHFTFSAFYSGGIAVVANRHFDMKKDNSIILGVGVTISLGGAKEIYDHSRPGETSSIKDFIWDIGGVVAGGLLAALII
jgi:putative lipoprotein